MLFEFARLRSLPSLNLFTSVQGGVETSKAASYSSQSAESFVDTLAVPTSPYTLSFFIYIYHLKGLTGIYVFNDICLHTVGLAAVHSPLLPRLKPLRSCLAKSLVE